jgi:CubicO group peptidase (beta-lactamase class C family)
MRFNIIGGIVAALCVLVAPSLAQTPQVASPSSPPALTHADLEAWLDGYMPYALRRGDVAGAVVVVVKDGQVVLQNGYGYADVATRRPVDAQTTLFRPGSVSKLITWTAVMQQVEQGRIDLDADINRYLDFKIPPFRGQPITMRQLMTHTAGFQDSLRDLVGADAATTPSLRQYLQDNLPARIYPPGQTPAYSNYGVALAGYIVERTSGEPFDAYIERHIFGPLGMKNASFREPLPAALRAQASSAYARASAPAKPYEMFAVRPAGSSAISGADMAHFMIAHLQDGQYQGQSILRPQTARLMHDSRLTVISPSVDRMALGFYEFDRNGHRIIGHEGDSIWFHSLLQLYPDDHVGLFLSLNSVGRDGAARAIRKGLMEGFADRYFPAPQPPATVTPAMAKADAQAMVGQYDVSEWAPKSFLSLANLFGQATVTTDGAGHIMASPAVSPNGELSRFEEITPLAWRAVDSHQRLAARVQGGHAVMWGLDGDSPFAVFTPTPAWRNAAWLLPLLEASLAALLVTAIAWPITALARLRYGAPFTLQGAAAHSYRWVRIAAAASGGLMLTWLVTVGYMAATFSITAAVDPWILTLHLLSIAVFPLAAAIALWNLAVAASTRRGWRGVVAMGWSAVLAISALTVLWVALVYRLISLSRAF